MKETGQHSVFFFRGNLSRCCFITCVVGNVKKNQWTEAWKNQRLSLGPVLTSYLVNQGDDDGSLSPVCLSLDRMG